MSIATPHILYSFRRCPYAMRARMALRTSQIEFEHREVELKNKPAEMLAQSPKGTVPVLITDKQKVIDESLDIMVWALEHHDPHRWLEPEIETKEKMFEIISLIDGPFKKHLDRYKYPNRFTHESKEINVAPIAHRDEAFKLLNSFETRLKSEAFLFGSRISLADIATFPFIRQFANTNREWFDALPLHKLILWLDALLQSELFITIMKKYKPWKSSAPQAIMNSD